MISDLAYFPTPCEDEIMYSVLARYHVHRGMVSAGTTNMEIFGRTRGGSLALPGNLDYLVMRLPEKTGFTLTRFFEQNTLFPMLTPFITKSTISELLNSLKRGNQRNCYHLTATLTESADQTTLRFCKKCAEEDIEKYGEMYWHRTHQAVYVRVCPRHNEFLYALPMSAKKFYSTYYVLEESLFDEKQYDFSLEFKEKMYNYACDIDWMLTHGCDYNYELIESIYYLWLRAHRLKELDGKLYRAEINRGLVNYYGEEYLALIGAYIDNTCPWVRKLFYTWSPFASPAYQLLLIRMLAGSAETFFTNPPKEEELPKLEDYKKFPFPCLNSACAYFLKEVIKDAPWYPCHGASLGYFKCKHCGFTYTRKGIYMIPKMDATYWGYVDSGSDSEIQSRNG